MSKAPDLATLLLEGEDISLYQMEAMSLTDKQRQNVIKLLEKRARLSNLKDRLTKSTESQQISAVEDPFEDAASKKEVRTSHLPKNALIQIEQLEQEVSQITDSLMASANHASLDTGEMKRRRLEAQFGNDSYDPLFDLTAASTTTIYSEIPSMGTRENIESIKVKIAILVDLKKDSESKLSSLQSEKNPIADEEVDPLDAFMNSTNDELIDEKIEKEKHRLNEIERVLTQFQKVHDRLSQYQFSDALPAKLVKRTIAPLEAAKRTAHPSVWDDELQKDLSVPQRQQQEKTKMRVSSAVVNPTQGGLYMMRNGDSVLVTAPAAAPTKEVDAEALRKKLGY